MTTTDRSYSNVAGIAALLSIGSMVISMVLVIVVYVQAGRISELEERAGKIHDRITVVEHRVERLDGVLDRALDAVAIARAVLEEERTPER